MSDQDQDRAIPEYSRPPERDTTFAGGSIPAPPEGKSYGPAKSEEPEHDYSEPPKRERSAIAPNEGEKLEGGKNGPRISAPANNPQDYANPPSRGTPSRGDEGAQQLVDMMTNDGKATQQQIITNYANRSGKMPADQTQEAIKAAGDPKDPLTPYVALNQMPSLMDKRSFMDSLASQSDHANAIATTLASGTDQHPPNVPGAVNAWNEALNRTLDGNHTVAQLAGGKVIVNNQKLGTDPTSGQPYKTQTYSLNPNQLSDVIKSTRWDQAMGGDIEKTFKQVQDSSAQNQNTAQMPAGQGEAAPGQPPQPQQPPPPTYGPSQGQIAPDYTPPAQGVNGATPSQSPNNGSVTGRNYAPGSPQASQQQARADVFARSAAGDPRQQNGQLTPERAQIIADKFEQHFGFKPSPEQHQAIVQKVMAQMGGQQQSSTDRSIARADASAQPAYPPQQQAPTAQGQNIGGVPYTAGENTAPPVTPNKDVDVMRSKSRQEAAADEQTDATEQGEANMKQLGHRVTGPLATEHWDRSQEGKSKGAGTYVSDHEPGRMRQRGDRDRGHVVPGAESSFKNRDAGSSQHPVERGGHVEFPEDTQQGRRAAQDRAPTDHSQPTGNALTSENGRYFNSLQQKVKGGEKLGPDEQKFVDDYGAKIRNRVSGQPAGGAAAGPPKVQTIGDVYKLPTNVPTFIDPNGIPRPNPNYRG